MVCFYNVFFLYDVWNTKNFIILLRKVLLMTEKELEKKIESTDKKLAKMKLPRGEGKITWKNKATCYLENKIREAFGFRGTSLKFIIRERKEKD